MKLTIMQPYLFPYIGYFQLIQASDSFVLYDDVNFIKGGWINRNFILSQGQSHRITLQLQGASSNVLINQVQVGKNRVKLLKSIQQNYTKAPYFKKVFPMIKHIVLNQEDNLAVYLDFGLRTICEYMAIQSNWHISSALKKDVELAGADKVLAICEELGADHYMNVPGGRSLYNSDMFAKKDLKLSFVEPNPIIYEQLEKTFVPNLSIIDVMMFNDQEECAVLLREYSLD